MLEPFREIWCVDFEFMTGSGRRPDPVCLVAHEIRSDRTIRLWRDQFGPVPPYAIDPSALFETVARYYLSAAGTSASVPAMAKTSDPVVKTAGIPMVESRADNMEIPTVEGLNSVEGLLRVAGNRKL